MNSHLCSDEDYKIWWLLAQSKDAISRVREKELRQHGISVMEAGALFFIQAIGDKPTPAEISRWIFRDHHTVSALLRRMEKKGLITKAKDVNRKNIWRVSLTEEGKKAYRQSVNRESIHAVMSSLSKNKRQRLESYLRTLRDQALKLSVREPTLPFP